MKALSYCFLIPILAVGLTARAATTNTPATGTNRAPNAPAAPKTALTPAGEAAARAALEKAYADGAATNKAATNNPAAAAAAPAATNAPAPANAAANATTNAAPTAPATAAATNQAPSAAARAATNAAGTNAAAPRPVTPRATTTPTNPAAPRAAQTTPATPGAPGAAAPAVPGAPGAPGRPGAPLATARASDGKKILPAGLIKFQDTDIGQVLEVYQELTGKTILKPSSLPPTKISVKTQTEMTADEAILMLDTLLSMNGITMVPQGTNFVKAVAENQADRTAAIFTSGMPKDFPEAGTYVTHVAQVTNVSPTDIVPVLEPFSRAPKSILAIPSTGILVLRDYAENVKRMVEMIERVDKVPQQDFESVVIPIKYALAGDIAQVLGSLTAGGGGGTTVGGRQQGGGGGLGGGLGRGGLGGSSGGLGQGGNLGQPYNPNNPNQYGQQATGLGGAGGAGAGGRSSFQNRLQQIVQRAATGTGGDIFVLNQTKIIADERINALLIFASKADLVTISNIIDKLDVVLAQVLIEAIVMEVALGNDLNYGVSYVQRNKANNSIGAVKNVPFLNFDNFSSMATNAQGALPSGFSYFGRFGDFDVTAQAVATDSRINVISRPRIQTSHAVQADLFVGQTRPYVTGSYSYFGGGPQTQFQQQQIGLTLQVLPLINAEGLVVMDIHTKIQQIGENIPIDATFSVPETIDREANAKVAVRDRETIMLGGFISTTKNKSASGVPILKDIPILGNLFRSSKDSDQRRELIILIRPTVLPTPQAAADFAARARSNLPSTRAAQREFEEGEQQLLDQENRRQEHKDKKLYNND